MARAGKDKWGNHRYDHLGKRHGLQKEKEMKSSSRPWYRITIALTAALFATACATSAPPYIAGTTVLSSERFSATHPPKVIVRPLDRGEVETIYDFPDKARYERLAKIDSAGSLLLAPVMVPFLLLFAFPD
jgi:hypothetical protein